MQHIDITNEDYRLIAYPSNGSIVAHFYEAVVGTEETVIIDHKQLAYITAVFIMPQELDPESNVYKGCMEVQSMLYNIRFMP